jgi:hypothetical protein
MNISDFTTDELLDELNKRSGENEIETKEDNSESVLVFGSIGNDAGKYFVEVFEKITSPDDLAFMKPYSIRVRFNSHRRYKGFYFKTDQFDKLKKSLDEDNEKFANWVKETNSIKFIEL